MFLAPDAPIALEAACAARTTALAARMMGAEDIWNHPAYFDYVDRWMTEDDTQQMADIAAHYKRRVPRERQGATWSEFVTEMWNTYRNNLPTGQRQMSREAGED